jgi:hypothetical protein
MFVVHAVIQANLYIRRLRSDQAMLGEPAPDPPVPATAKLVDKARQQPWHILVGEEPPAPTDGDSATEDNTKHA